MFDGVGRRRDQKSGELVNIGEFTLNGFERNQLYRNNGDGTFTDVAYVNEADRSEDGRGLSIFDYDADGRPDLLLRNYNQPAQLLRNASRSGHWLELRLIGEESNRDAVGARVEVRADGRRQLREVHRGSGYLSGSSLVQHFGLGSESRVDTVRVLWPSGTETVLTGVPADRRLILREGEEQPSVWRVGAVDASERLSRAEQDLRSVVDAAESVHAPCDLDVR